MTASVDDRLVREWVPDELWQIVEPSIPAQRARLQGGGPAMADPRAVLAAVGYVLRTGCAWRHLPSGFGGSKVTAHRRFGAGTKAGLWRRLHRAVLDELGGRGWWTGPGRCSTPPASGRQGGRADRGEPS